MRSSTAWKTNLAKRLRGDAKNADALLDVELALTLVSEICPRESPGALPALLSGNSIPELSPAMLSDGQRGKIARARNLLRYFQGEAAWRSALTEYQSESEQLRMFDIRENNPAVPLESSICPDRRSIYLQALETPPLYSDSSADSATAGDYYIRIRENDGDGESNWHLVSFSSEDIESIPASDPVHLRSVKNRKPLTIPWQALRETADWMDARDSGNWRRRLYDMRVSLGPNDDDSPKDLTIDGLFHLVGMVSSGKSTLMDIVAVWAARKGLRIMLVVGDNVDVVTRVEKFRSFGINSVPLMGMGGRDRQSEQIGRVAWSEVTGKRKAWQDPRLNWVSPICPIVGFGQSDMPAIPIGAEPCEELHVSRDGQASRKRCPLMSVCPTHRARNGMMDAQIWVGTPFSLVLTRSPAQSVIENTRLLEMVYRECDLMIVDEADRVQTQFDEMFAPWGLLSSGYGLMEQLDRDATTKLGDSLSSLVARREVLDWSRSQGQAKQAISVLLNMCASSRELRKWIMQHGYFTAFSLAALLHSEVAPDQQSAMPSAMLTYLRSPDADAPLQRLAGELLLRGDNSVNLPNRENEVFEWLRECYRGGNLGDVDEALLLIRLKAISLTAILDNELKSIFDGWDVAEAAYSLGLTGNLPFQRPPRDYASLVPRSPTGNLFGFRYEWDEDGDARIDMFRCSGTGRWLLTNLHDMFKWLDGIDGPHVMLLSGSSWAPGSSSYHVQAPVNGVLMPPSDVVDSIAKSTASYDYALNPKTRTPIRVSGMRGDRRTNSLLDLLRYLSEGQNDNKSLIESELDTLEQSDDGGDCILLVTGSYNEAKRAYQFLSGTRSFAGSVRYLERDTNSGEDRWSDQGALRRGAVHQFAEQAERILIAPLMAIERGHNIIDESGSAVIGSVFFLVRPMPVPDQFGTAVRKMNFWAMNKWARSEHEVKADSVLSGWQEYGRSVHSEWWRILRGYTSFEGMNSTERSDLAWSQLVALWQTCGRAVRGGRKVRIHFCDAAFAPKTAQGEADSESTSLLLSMRTELSRFMDNSTAAPASNEREHWVCEALYRPWATALATIRNLDE